MNRRFGTAPAHGTADTKRLAQWLVLVLVLVVIAYLSRILGGKPSPQVLYEWSTFVGGLIQDAVILAVVLAIARPAWPLLALRRPADLGRAALYVVVAIVAVYLFESVYSLIVDPGNEQGLTPAHWEPAHAATYIANAILICTWVPLTEELTYRGLGYSLLAPFGRWPAILAIGVIFGLAHGLVLSFPVLAAFGCALAWIRSKTDSVYPGMVVHGLFNAIALVAAVTIGS